MSAVVGTFAFAALGARYRFIRRLGLDTILTIVTPAYLVHAGWIGSDAVGPIRSWVARLDILGWFIAVIILGSVFGIEWRKLRTLSVKMLAPAVAATVAGLGIGAVAGTVLGSGAVHTMFYVVVPIMSGGITSGAMPLSLGYASLSASSQSGHLAAILPAIFVGNLLAICLAGLLHLFKPGCSPDVQRETVVAGKVSGFGMVLGVGVIVLVYGFGTVVARLTGLASPLIMLAIAVVLHASQFLPLLLIDGVRAMYRFCLSVMVYPILFIVGLVIVSWDQMVAGFAPQSLATIASVIAGMAISGHLVSRVAGVDPGDGTLIALNRAAMGGSGNIAILHAADRMALMPVAQIVTRVGGAATVAGALLIVPFFS